MDRMALTMANSRRRFFFISSEQKFGQVASPNVTHRDSSVALTLFFRSALGPALKLRQPCNSLYSGLLGTRPTTSSRQHIRVPCTKRIACLYCQELNRGVGHRIESKQNQQKKKKLDVKSTTATRQVKTHPVVKTLKVSNGNNDDKGRRFDGQGGSTVIEASYQKLGHREK